MRQSNCAFDYAAYWDCGGVLRLHIDAFPVRVTHVNKPEESEIH